MDQVPIGIVVASVPYCIYCIYCIDLIGGPRLETDPAVCRAFRLQR